MGARGKISAAEMSNVVPLAAPKPGAIAPDRPKPPAHLKPATKAWWNDVVGEYALEAHHLRLLQAACESWDRLQQARAALRDHGLTFTDDRGNPKIRPEVAVETQSRIAFARLVRELDLDTEAPKDSPRPPGLRSNRGS